MAPPYQLSTKQLGFILIGLSVALFLVLLSSTIELMEAADIRCREICGLDMNISCPHAKNIPVQSYIGFSLTSLLFLLGILVVLNDIRARERLLEREKRLKRIIAGLKEDEKRVLDIINKSEGVIFQSELVKKTGFSKAKVSRILDKLEAKGLIERKRHGMTNIIILRG